MEIFAIDAAVDVSAVYDLSL